MKSTYLKSICAIALTTFLTFSKPTLAAVEKVVATVNGIPVLNSQVSQALGNKANTPANRQNALQEVIDQILIEQAIQQSGIKIDPQQVQLAIENIAIQNGLSYSQFLQALAHQGMNIDQLRQEISQQILMAEIRNYSISQNISVTPEQVDELANKLYQKAKMQKGFKPALVPEYLARHILLPTNPLLNDTQAKAKLSQIRADILKGKISFAEAARINSKDYLSGADGGSLGWGFADRYVPEFQKALSQTKKGTISQPFKTQFGWHIVEVDDIRHIDRSQDAYRQKAYEDLINKQAEVASQDWLKALRQQAEIKILN
ncbi:peptidylprolyl isomerase [Mergibacter septicus]|uniref:Peptidylprolyl isomerase n=1 Tax=Mergibacter septicus TaxID=221402 RepID=A0A8D4J0J1_9PAST|nr:peptidylprolyl isomerase [Mergibacter septicus]AWX15792.1 peptidylprolyl isomerase [Mergibacter septicus]QDJ15045.1 peptidylprolyl isomerase [Mergibacter septicus]UTU47531.1 peptidylprolyl isomerase [Mergibacter septicus]WMR95288.1 peptidylprolyl isomerase [Mergibacter septicus]